VLSTSLLILGYGNPLRGDDAMGLVAAERLGGIAVHQLMPELADRIAEAHSVIFLDADATVAPGEISVKAVEPADGTLDHHATPGGLLRLVRTVYGAAPKSWLIGMGGEDFDLREGLSPAAERAVERAVAFVQSSS
jgi:hydrogenase maturation protease